LTLRKNQAAEIKKAPSTKVQDRQRERERT